MLGGARLEAQSSGGERAGDGGARAGRAAPVARQDQTRARAIDDGAEVIQELGLERAGPGRGRGGGSADRRASHDAKTNRRGDGCVRGLGMAGRTFGSPTPRPRRGRAPSSRLGTARGDVGRERSDRERRVEVEGLRGGGRGVAGVRRALERFSSVRIKKCATMRLFSVGDDVPTRRGGRRTGRNRAEGGRGDRSYLGERGRDVRSERARRAREGLSPRRAPRYSLSGRARPTRRKISATGAMDRPPARARRFDRQKSVSRFSARGRLLARVAGNGAHGVLGAMSLRRLVPRVGGEQV